MLRFPFRGALACVVPFALAACGLSVDWGGPTVAGSGTVVTETRRVTGFDRIEIGGDFDVTVIQGSTPSLTLTGDDNLLPLVRTEVRDGSLVVEPEKDFRSSRDIEVAISTPSLRGISSSGSWEVAVTGIRSSEFRAAVSGSSEMAAEGDFGVLAASVSWSGEIAMEGTAETIDASVSGSGEMDLARVRARSANVRVSGSGDVRVFATEGLNASVSGSGDVVYGGSPRVSREISGSGSVRPE
jgi:hypothetical protein